MINISSKTANQINKLLKRVAGASYAIVSSNDILYKEHYGYINLERKKTNDNSFFMIGSNTKIITAIAVMQLHEQNKINIDDNIEKYIPNLHFQNNFDKSNITIRQILSHRSGLNCDDWSIVFDETFDTDSFINKINQMPLTKRSGTMYSYSNIGYCLIGVLIETVTKIKFETYVKEYISDPLRISLNVNPNISPNHSKSFSSSKKYGDEFLKNIVPAGSNAYATLNDMIKLMQMFLSKDTTLLSKKTLELMLERPFYNNNLCYETAHGLGFMFKHEYTADFEQIGHGGDTIYQHSTFDFYPKLDYGIIVLTNSTTDAGISRRIRDLLLNEVLEIKQIKIHKPSINLIDDSHFSTNIKGKYATFGISLDIYENKLKELETKISFLKINLTKHNNIYLCKPKGISRLPLFSKQIQKLAFGVQKIEDELVLNQITLDEKTIKINKFAIKIEEQRQPVNTLIAGDYLIRTNNKLFQKISIKIEKNNNIVAFLYNKNTKIKMLLKHTEENKYIILGYGRNSNETIFIDNNELQYQGLFFDKYIKPQKTK